MGMCETNPRPDDDLFDDFDLDQFVRETGTDPNDLERLSVAVEKRKVPGKEYTIDELMTLAMTMAPDYGIAPCDVERAFQQARVNPDPRCPVCRAEVRPADVKPDVDVRPDPPRVARPSRLA